ncbi:MAG: hypothetical protein ACREHD_04580 [Pirellulales bacterium]
MTQPRFNDESLKEPGLPEDDPVARLQLQIPELLEYFCQQWVARTDRALLGLRRLVVLAIAGAVALLALAAWVVTAVVLLLTGTAGGLATVLQGRLWLASLIVGAAALMLVIMAVAVLYSVWRAASKQRTKHKYELRKREQRRQFGRSAHERASGT